MPDKIQLLPDAVANQIAAGEVVQRPASAVKELLENAIDAQASAIQLIIKNAGKTLIQVVDNGIGMSPTDARLSLERHATSKIKKAEDLFSLHTMGFRGEALPSIAAVSQMEMISKSNDSDFGSVLKLSGSEIINQEPCQASIGTNIKVKNLFFNIPARRNFLKSNGVENKHIIEEFTRVAMINPSVDFRLINDDNEVFNLISGSFRQRIVSIFGAKYNQRLVPVEEETDIVQIKGFVGKPEFAKKTRGEQFLFVNQRFIKSPYFNHAIQAAFEELLPKDVFPSYFLKLSVDPAKIDINIHPTKTEVKFEEERSIYAIIRTSIRQALGKYNVAPSIDFDQDNNITVPQLKAGQEISIPKIQVNTEFNPFVESKVSKQAEVSFPFQREKKVLKGWENLYKESSISTSHSIKQEEIKELEKPEHQENKIIQIHKKYLLAQLKSGFVLIDQQRAHERILIENLSEQLANAGNSSQQLLFPEELNLSASDFSLVEELLEDLKNLGFDISLFGKDSFILRGIPSQSKETSGQSLIESLLEEYKENQGKLKNKPRINLVHSLAKSMSIKAGTVLNQYELQHLFDSLFATEMPYHLPNGKAIVLNFTLDDLNKKFNK